MAEIKEIRNAMRKKKRNRTIRRICIVIILLALVVAIAVNRENLTPEVVTQWLSGTFSADTSEEGLPVSLPSGETVSLLPAGNNIVLTTQTNVYFYSARGKQLRNVQHLCKNVQSTVAGENVLVYSVGAKNAIVETKTKTVVSIKTENNIVTGAISKNGRTAIVTESDVYTSEMKVYDKNGNAVFKWTPSGSVITNVAISSDGHRVVAATVYTEGGVLMTGIHLFETGKSEALFSVKLRDEIAVSMAVERNFVRVITDSSVTDINDNGEIKGTLSFDEKKLIGTAGYDNGSIVVFEDVNDPSKSLVEVVNNKTEVKAQASVAQAVLDIDCDGNDIYLMTDTAVLKYSTTTAVKTGEAKVLHGADRLCVSSAGAFVTTDASELIRAEFN